MACYPRVPTGYNLGIGCAVLSYDGKLFYGLTADTHAAPDARRLRDFILASFEELCRAAGIRKVARRTAAPKARKRRPRPFEAEESSPTAAPAETPAAQSADGRCPAPQRTPESRRINNGFECQARRVAPAYMPGDIGNQTLQEGDEIFEARHALSSNCLTADRAQVSRAMRLMWLNQGLSRRPAWSGSG